VLPRTASDSALRLNGRRPENGDAAGLMAGRVPGFRLLLPSSQAPPRRAGPAAPAIGDETAPFLLRLPTPIRVDDARAPSPSARIARRRGGNAARGWTLREIFARLHGCSAQAGTSA
jgi:hypothetical protein